jgi:hypothetical protein
MEIKFAIDTSEIGPFLEEKYDEIEKALANKLNAIDYALIDNIVGGKLSGNPVKSHTSKLAGSVRALPVVNDGSSLTGTVEAGGGAALYARYLEDGTAPHRIAAKNKKALAFMVDGKQAFAKYVNHPGTRAYKFMAGTLTENQRAIFEQLQAAANEAIRD